MFGQWDNRALRGIIFKLLVTVRAGICTEGGKDHPKMICGMIIQNCSNVFIINSSMYMHCLL